MIGKTVNIGKILLGRRLDLSSNVKIQIRWSRGKGSVPRSKVPRQKKKFTIGMMRKAKVQQQRWWRSLSPSFEAVSNYIHVWSLLRLCFLCDQSVATWHSLEEVREELPFAYPVSTVSIRKRCYMTQPGRSKTTACFRMPSEYYVYQKQSLPGTAW